MKRRTALASALAGVALALVPAAALAYVPTDVTGADTTQDLFVTCSENTVDPNADFTCTVTSETFPEGTPVTLAAEHADGTPGVSPVAGIASATKNLDASQSAVFFLTAPDVTTGGIIHVAAFAEDPQGSLEYEGTRYYAATPGIVAIAVTEPVDEGTTAGGTDSGLSNTGFDGAAIAITAGVLLVGGAGAVLVASRRRNQA